MKLRWLGGSRNPNHPPNKGIVIGIESTGSLIKSTKDGFGERLEKFVSMRMPDLNRLSNQVQTSLSVLTAYERQEYAAGRIERWELIATVVQHLMIQAEAIGDRLEQLSDSEFALLFANLSRESPLGLQHEAKQYPLGTRDSTT